MHPSSHSIGLYLVQAYLWCNLLGRQDLNFLPTNGLCIEPLKAKLVAESNQFIANKAQPCLKQQGGEAEDSFATWLRNGVACLSQKLSLEFGAGGVPFLSPQAWD